PDAPPRPAASRRSAPRPCGRRPGGGWGSCGFGLSAEAFHILPIIPAKAGTQVFYRRAPAFRVDQKSLGSRFRGNERNRALSLSDRLEHAGGHALGRGLAAGQQEVEGRIEA